MFIFVKLSPYCFKQTTAPNAHFPQNSKPLTEPELP